MTPRLRLAAFAATLAALSAFAPAQENGVRPGMTPAEVRDRLGPPGRASVA